MDGDASGARTSTSLGSCTAARQQRELTARPLCAHTSGHMDGNTRVTTLISLVLVATALPLWAGGASEPDTPRHEAAAPHSTRLVRDASGREVSFDSRPQRIVAAGPATLMIADLLYAFPVARQHLVALGRIEQGRGDFLSAIDPRIAQLPRLERRPSIEAIAAQRPDLVVMKSSARAAIGQQIEELGLRVFYVNLETPDDYRRDVRALGAALYAEARAEQIVAYIDLIVARTGELAPPDPAPDTLFLAARLSDDGLTLQVPPAGWIQTSIVTLAGGRPLWTEDAVGRGWTTVTIEQIAAWNPEAILLTSYDAGVVELRDNLAAQPPWDRLEAVLSDRFFAVPLDFYSWDQPDLRWLLGLQWAAVALRNGDLAGLEPTVREFYATMFDLDAAAFERHIAPLLVGDGF